MAEYSGDRPPCHLTPVLSSYRLSLSPLSYLIYTMEITPAISQGCWRLEWSRWGPIQGLELARLSSLSPWHCLLFCLEYQGHLNCVSSFFFFFFLLKNSFLKHLLPPSFQQRKHSPPPVYHFHLHSSFNPSLPPPGHCCTLQHLSQALIINSTVAGLVYYLSHSLECKLHEDFMPYSCCSPSK